MTDPRVWFVTGAGSGFGRALAEAALDEGETVVAAMRRPAAVDDLVAAHPGRVDPIAFDVSDGAAIEPAARGAIERHGRVDVLVNKRAVPRWAPSRRRKTSSCVACSTCTSSVPSRSPGPSCRTCGSAEAALW